MTFSVMVEAGAFGLSPERWSRTSLAAALAVCSAVRDLAPNVPAAAKWPNDVYVGGRKLCGILVEVPPRRPGRLVIGVGINVNNELTQAPEPISAIGTSLAQQCGRTLPLPDVLVAVLKRLEQELRLLGSDEPSLAARWAKYCILRDRIVTVDQVGGRWTGRCRGVAEDGALVIETESGEAMLYAGTVVAVD